MDSGTITAIADDWWSRDFGCSPGDLRPTCTRVQEHAGDLLGNCGIWILVAGGAPLISLPPIAMAALSDGAATWSSSIVADPKALLARLRDVRSLKIEKIIGPAFIGYGSRATLDLRDADCARELGESDHPAINDLQRACTPEEWEHGGSAGDGIPLFGAHTATGALSALAGYETWNATIAHISIVTHPEHRSRGLGRAAFALATRHALSTGLVPQYRTLRANTPSMRIAERLGFAEYGFSVYIKLSTA